MVEIVWTDVQHCIPQPLQAHDAHNGQRRVEARLWMTKAANSPYKVSVRLLEADGLIEEWQIEYVIGAGFNSAVRTYAEWRRRATLWLLGNTPGQVRPTKRNRM